MPTDLLDRHLSIAPHVRAVSLDGTMILIDMQRGVYFGLDDIGCLIWRD